MVPVSFSPSALKLNVVEAVSPPRPGMSPVHFPEMSAAIAKATNSPREQANLSIVFMVSPFLKLSSNLTRTIVLVRGGRDIARRGSSASVRTPAEDQH